MIGPSDGGSKTHSAESDTLETGSGLKLLSVLVYPFEKSNLKNVFKKRKREKIRNLFAKKLTFTI